MPTRPVRARVLVALLLPAVLLLAACGAADRGGSSGPGDSTSFAKSRLSIMAPADPGGGWDETARAIQKSARDAKLATSGVEVYNVPGAGGSIGGTDQLLVGLLAQAAGVDARKTKYVAYSGGGEAKAAILSGSVAAGVSGLSEFADQIEAGKMRAPAVASSEPVDVGGKQV